MSGRNFHGKLSILAATGAVGTPVQEQEHEVLVQLQV